MSVGLFVCVGVGGVGGGAWSIILGGWGWVGKYFGWVGVSGVEWVWIRLGRGGCTV